MCNLYSMTESQVAIRELARALRDGTGNLPPLSGIFPDYPAPIVRTGLNGTRELVMARWGMPSSKRALFSTAMKRARRFEARGQQVDFSEMLRLEPDKGTTNIRNTALLHWRPWLTPASRCLVPFTAFSEPDHVGGNVTPVWFVLGRARPLGFFAGIWTSWTSVRRVRDGMVTCDVFGFLTTQPNKEVAAVHRESMPVILTRPEEWEAWMRAPWKEAARLQRPLSDGALRVAAKGEK